MSGGSYDYACYKFESGEIDRVLSVVPDMIEKIDQLLIDLQAGKIMDYVGGQHVVLVATDLRLMSLGSARARLSTALAKAKDASDAVRHIAAVAHDIEWWQSGDYGADRVIEGCVESVCKALGLPVPK